MLKKLNVLHILKSTKRDIDIVNLYNSRDYLENTYLFDTNFVKSKNSEENYEYFLSEPNIHFYEKVKDIKIDQDFDIIIVYGLNDKQIKLCFKFASEKTKLVWKSLGGDIYNKHFIRLNDIYQPETYKALKQLGLVKKNNNKLFFNLFKKLTLSDKFFCSVDYISPMLESEMELILKNKTIKAEYIHIPLGDNIYRKKSNISKIPNSATDIYIGSSASPVANHLDVFKKIKETKFQGNIHVTLSYKINKEYQKIVLKNGFDLFGSKFHPQTSFFSKSEFEEMLNKCSIAIFNNDRQEGLLSILTCIDKGIKVFLAENGYIYKYLLKYGYNVFSFQKEFTNQNLNIQKKHTYKNEKENIFNIDEYKAVDNAFDLLSKKLNS